MTGPISTFMLCSVAFLVLLSTTSALKVPFKRHVDGSIAKSLTGPTRYSFGQASTSNDSIGDLYNIRYVTNITINGVAVQVALDTGSTDLWVMPPGGIGSFNDTNIPVALYYGDGSYGTKGTIGVSPFTFGSYHVERQAFLNAATCTTSGMEEYGIYGLMGLSFDFTTASPINEAIQATYGPDATWGRSVLRNIFAQNPTEPNFIGIALSRTGDMEDTTGGSFTIGEYDSRFAGVANETKLPQYPKDGDRWTTLLEGIFVDGKGVNIASTIAGVPAGQAQALLDTGDPNSIFPLDVLDGIYSQIPGAALYNPSSQTHIWILPCNTTTHVEFVFGSERYSIHPLDLSTISHAEVGGQQYTACVPSFFGANNWGKGEYDISLGDTFLRNVYSVFDFGDTLANGSRGDPYMQLFSVTNPTTANAEVTSIRGQTLASLPPEMDPAALVAALLESNPSTATNSSDGAASSGTNKTLVSDNNVPASYDDPLVRRYGPIIIALLAGNLLLTMALVVFSVMGWIRRGSSKKKSRSWVIDVDPHYVPVKSTADHEEAYPSPYEPYSQ